MRPTALETLQPTEFAVAAAQTGEEALPGAQPNSLEIAGRETVPATLQTLAETATKTAFESLAKPVPTEGRGTVIFTTNTKLEDDPQSGS